MTEREPPRTRIKICGVMNVEIAHAAVEAGVDAIGLVFARQSPRMISFDTAVEIVESLPPMVTPIGLFQLSSRLDEDLEDWWCEWVQLHGEENEELVAEVADTHRVIRGFQFEPEQIRRWDACPYTDALLIDGSKGGGGKSFDHGELKAIRARVTKPILLAGGLTPENVGEAIRAVRPYAVDVSSGVEREHGVKDAELIRRFCAAVHEADCA